MRSWVQRQLTPRAWRGKQEPLGAGQLHEVIWSRVETANNINYYPGDTCIGARSIWAGDVALLLRRLCYTVLVAVMVQKHINTVSVLWELVTTGGFELVVCKAT